MTLPTVNEVINTTVQGLNPKAEVDYKSQLEAIGLTENQISPELIWRFKEALRIYQSGVNNNLNLLEEKVFTGINAHDTDNTKKIEAITTWIETQESNSGNLTENITQTVIDAGKKAATQAAQSTETALESGIDNAVKSKLWSFGDIFKGFSIWAIFTKILAAIFGKFGFENIFWEKNEKTDVTITNDQEGTDTEDNTWENPEENKEAITEKIDKTRTAWYILLSQISGMPFEHGSREVAILWELDAGKPPLTILELKWKFLSIWDKNIKSEVWLEDTDYSNEEIYQVMIGLIGPINEEFFTAQLWKKETKALIGAAPKYNESIQDIFTKKELEKIHAVDYDYTRLSVGIVSRLAVLSIKQSLIALKEVPGGYAKKARNLFSSIDTKDLYGESESSLYPKWVSFAFSDILWVKTTYTAQEIEKKANDKWYELTESDVLTIGKIVNYKDTIIGEIWKYSLETQWFQENIENNLTWGNVISLYALLRGGDISTAQGMDTVMIYTWIYGLLDGTTQGEYQSQALKKLIEKDNSESKVLQVFIFRVLEVDRNVLFESIKNTKWFVDGMVGALPWINNISDSKLRVIAINVLEIWGISLFLKLIMNMPVMRAVLLATTWVIWTLVYLGIKEKYYQDVNSRIGKIYIDFLEEIAPHFDKENHQTLIQSVERWDISIWDIYSKSLQAPSSIMNNFMKKMYS